MKSYKVNLFVLCVFILSMLILSVNTFAQGSQNCIQCSDCELFETWKSMCTFTYQICIIQGLPESFCLDQKSQCEKNIDDLIAECERICKDSCEETDTCPDNVCATGENCPADANACGDTMCYEPTCLDGCSMVAVPSGSTDESCSNDRGCTNTPCSCDGSGNCISEQESDCHTHARHEWLEDNDYDIQVIEEGCSDTCGKEYLIEIRERSNPHCGERLWVWLEPGIDLLDTGNCYRVVIGDDSDCGHIITQSGGAITCRGCEDSDTCEIDISFDKEQYCVDDSITMTVQLKENNLLTDYDEIRAVVHLPGGGGVDVTERIDRRSQGTYTIDGFVGSAGQRTLEVESRFGTCDMVEDATYNVLSSSSPECRGEDAEVCNVEISFDKESYCPGDDITITAEFYESGALSTPDSYEVSLHKSGTTRDITEHFRFSSLGVYTSSNTVGIPGQRTVNIGAVFPGCDASDSQSFTVHSSDSPECSGGGDETCPDAECSSGENCPQDAVDCLDRMCYEPTCTDGCGETVVPSGSGDESCNHDRGCTSPPCSCDGDGNCASESDSDCHAHANPTWVDDGMYKIRVNEVGCMQQGCAEGDGEAREALIEIMEGDHCGEEYWLWIDTGMSPNLPDAGTCYDAEIFTDMHGAECGHVVRYLMNVIDCPVCEEEEEQTCSIDVSYDKSIYCEGDSISITAEYKARGDPEDPVAKSIILERGSSRRDLTNDFIRIREGTYVINNRVGTEGVRTLELTSRMNNGCTAETQSRFSVMSSANCVECESPSQCDDNDACTIDGCSADGACTHEDVTTCISDDGCCPLESGCNPVNDNDCEPECSGPAQCDDNNMCTDDSCVDQMCTHESKTVCLDDDGCCPGECTKSNDNDCIDMSDVLIVALKNNMDDVYGPVELSQIENKIRVDYINALRSDGLTARFFYLDEDETSDIVAVKVAKSETHNPNSIDGVLEELIKRSNAKYIIIIGGEDRFPMGIMSGFKSDDFYANYGPANGRIDIPVGRILDPNNGDYEQIMTALETHIALHNSGGLDLSNHLERTLGNNYLTMECFSLHIWGERCPENPNCNIGTSDSRTSASGKDFFYLTQHGSPGPPQSYTGALRPGDLNSMDLEGAVWMIVPCHGGVIDYSTASQGITQMFAKRGGAVFFGSTYFNCCANQGTTCTEQIDNGGVGALYYRYARNFAVGTRIGDAYLSGKNEYLSEVKHSSRVFINNLYGDPTLKIKRMW